MKLDDSEPPAPSFVVSTEQEVGKNVKRFQPSAAKQSLLEEPRPRGGDNAFSEERISLPRLSSPLKLTFLDALLYSDRSEAFGVFLGSVSILPPSDRGSDATDSERRFGFPRSGRTFEPTSRFVSTEDRVGGSGGVVSSAQNFTDKTNGPI